MKRQQPTNQNEPLAPKRMGREELAQCICGKLDPILEIEPRDALLILDTLTQTIQQTLRAGRNVCIHGFGTFQAIKLAAGKVRNPRVARGPLAFKEVGPRIRYRWKPGTSF